MILERCSENMYDVKKVRVKVRHPVVVTVLVLSIGSDQFTDMDTNIIWK